MPGNSPNYRKLPEWILLKNSETAFPKNLHKKLGEVNAEKRLSGRAPSLADLTEMINQAKELEPKVTY